MWNATPRMRIDATSAQKIIVLMLTIMNIKHNPKEIHNLHIEQDRIN